MSEIKKIPFIGYEYKEIIVPNEHALLYMDCYESFGWEMEGDTSVSDSVGVSTIHMKRDRKIINKMELTRLQRKFEACARELQSLEQSKTGVAMAWAMSVGLIGTVFMAGAVLAITNTPPIYWLSVLLAVPGFAGWGCPYFLYGYKLRVQTHKIQPLVEEKYDEIYEVCEKAHSLLL